MSVAKARAKQEERAVGLFESQRYLHLEATKMSDPNEVEWTTEFVELLKTSCSPVIHSTQSGLKAVSEWLANVRMGRLHHIRDAAILSILPTKSRPAIRARARIETRRSAWNGTIDKLKQLRNDLEKNLREFKETTRFLVLDPYRGIIDSETTHSQPATPTPRSPHTPTVASPLAEGFEHEHHHRADSHDMRRAPPHRHLFNCYVYQYNLIRTAEIAIEMLDEILRLEESEDRPWPHCRLWTPVEGFTWKRGLVSEPNERADDDDDPNIIQGLQHTSPYESNESSRTKLDLSSDPNKDRKEKSTVNVEEAIQPSSDSTRSHNLHRDDSPTTPTQPQLPPGFVTGDLGLPKSRDPDALPPRNFIEWILGLLYHFVVGLGGGNSVFAIKAGILTIVLCLPSFIKASAEFAYKNRFIWGIFIGQLTIARFRGDTAFGWISRVFATFGGGITGMVVWYISAGSGRGSPIGLAATCAVAFPFFFYARLYWNIAPITNIIFFVTSALVVGYSYQDMVISLPGNPGVGWEVSWRRFVLVSAGVTAAFIASFLPPSMTIRRYEREVLATTSCELGSLYCAILSFANTKQEEDIQEIIASLVAVRNKLNKALALRANVGLEFSLRGRWPADRYKRIADLQIAISYSLSHLMSVLKHLESPWARAFLKRTRFIDPNFQGDILAVVSMITYALRTGSPLPQITPCPLLDRFMLQNHGLNVIHKEAEEDYGLPRSITLETVKNEQYMMFCVGISTAYGVICRLDRLMVAVKEVVGEHYHIHGVGIAKSLNRESIQVVGGIDLSARVAVPRFGDEERGRRTM